MNELILFSKTDALGDQLWATGTVAAILEGRPEARVVWLVRAGYESVHTLLEGSIVFLPDVRRDPAPEAARLKKIVAPASASFWRRAIFVPVPLNAYSDQPPEETVVAWWLDFALALQADHAIAGTVSLNWLDQALVFGSAAKSRIGFESENDDQPLPHFLTSLLTTRRLNSNFTQTVNRAQSGHEGDNLARLAEPVTGTPSVTKIRLGLNGEAPPADAIRIILAPGTGDPQRIYPLKPFAAAMARLVQSQPSLKDAFLLLEGPQDAAVCAELASELQRLALGSTTLKVNPQDLRPVSAVLRTARLLVCNESFWVHLASALETPTVALWGLGHWNRFTPRQGRVTVLHTEMLCQNCDWHCCWSTRHCISDLSVDAIANACKARLASTPPLDGLKDDCVPSPLETASIRLALRRQRRQLVQYSKIIEADRDARLKAIEAMQQQLEQLGRGRHAAEARVAEVQQTLQGTQNYLASVESDRSERLAAIQVLQQQLAEHGRARQVAEGRLSEINQAFAGVEAVNAARLGAIEDMQRQLELHGKKRHEAESRVAELSSTLGGLRSYLETVEADRAARLNSIQQLQQQLKELQAGHEQTVKYLHLVEADSAARLAVIQDLQKKLDSPPVENDKRRSI